MMYKRKCMVFLYSISLISLFAGLFIYSVFKENTYVFNISNNILPFKSLQKKFLFLNNDFIKHNLVDFLWSISFTAWLYIIIKPSRNFSIILSSFVGVFGILFESAQLLGVINGTFDILDIILYFFGSLFIYIILIYLTKEKNK